MKNDEPIEEDKTECLLNERHAEYSQSDLIFIILATKPRQDKDKVYPLAQEPSKEWLGQQACKHE